MRAPPQLDFAVILSQPREGPHASGLPREESTVRRVAPQLDFVYLLPAQEALMHRVYLARKHRHEGETTARPRCPPQPAEAGPYVSGNMNFI